MRLINADELKTAFPYGEYIRTESVRATIDHMPTIEPEQRKGKWIKQNPMVDSEECSECGYNIIGKEFETPYCPWCGSYNGGDAE